MNRLLAFGVAATFAALTCVAVPATANAATPNAATPHAATPDAQENDVATAGTPPTSGLGPCVSTTGTEVCFEAYGDKWWVKDTKKDGASATVAWADYVDGSLYRDGVCRNSLGAGKWGVCNKNYYEGSTLYFTAVTYDASADTIIAQSPEEVATA